MATDVAPQSTFGVATRRWFEQAFGTPTPAQAGAWPAIARGEHVLVCAPTGSGKTLAAFLAGLDRLLGEERRPGTGPALLYLSPLKALNYDVERNLRSPLAGIRAMAAAAGEELRDVEVAVRTGDTPADARRRMVRRPPDVLITTPESLFLMLTSSQREILRDVRTVIIDEVHAMAATKRGAHLALSLERLSSLCAEEPQRVALSATQRPLEEVARFVGGNRPVTIVDAGVRKQLDLEVRVPVEDLADLGYRPDSGNGLPSPLADVQGATDGGARSIWPAIYPELLELVHTHRSTLIFVNSRRLAERLALRLNELAEAPVARAHHGSLSREARSEIEEALKAGELPCLVATSSLELGIDMGAIDLVCQVESPGSVARGLQRVGRSGHQVGEASRGRIFPKFRGDLLECAVVAGRMERGLIEETRVPKNPLDVLSQQLVGACSEGPVAVDDLYAMVLRAYPYRDLPRGQFDGVLDLLAGRYPSDEFAELRPRLVWDRIEGTVRARDGAIRIAIANAGTIPDRGLFGVYLVDGSGRVGELDEEMVYEAREGQVFLLGASSWRIEEITRDRVLVSPAPGVPGAIPFWKGDRVGRPAELGAAVGQLCRELSTLSDETAEKLLTEQNACEPRAAANLVAFVRDQERATGVMPSDRTIVVERFRDEIGDWRLCILSPYGGRVHAPWALALGAELRRSTGLDVQALWSDDGIIIHLPDTDTLPEAELVALDPDTVEDVVVGELGGSALYGARFRENAARALLIPRRRPGQRTPLWQQRLRAQSLLQVAERYGSFPIILETYRELLQDHFDLPALRDLLAKLRRREIALVAVETPEASPFAQSLAFDFVARAMYEDDTPAAERRMQALTLDKDLLRELLGTDELRDLLDPDALVSVERDLAAAPGSGPDGLHDLLRRSGDLNDREIAERGDDLLAVAAQLIAERRALRVRIAGENRLIAIEDAGRFRDALGVATPSGVPAVFLEPVENALASLLARFARRRGPFTTIEAAERYGLAEHVAEAELAALEAAGRLVRGGLRPGGSGIDWCDPDVLRRIRRASVAALRRAVEPVEPAALARFAPGWHGVERGGRGSLDRLRDVLVPLQWLPLAPDVWERDILPRRVDGYRASWLDELCATGELVWIGADGGRVAFLYRDEAPLFGPPPGAAPAPQEAIHELLRGLLAERPRFLAELTSETGLPHPELTAALWELVSAGEVTNDAFAPLRAARTTPAPRQAARVAGRRLARRRSAPAGASLGRWSATAALYAHPAEPGERARAIAELLLERHGVLTRRAVAAEQVPGGFSGVYRALSDLETLGACRRGWFVDGRGGAQFALPGAIERLRDAREAPIEPIYTVLATTDPANLYGATLPWPRRSAGRAARASGAYVVLRDGEPELYVERGGRSLLTLSDAALENPGPALAALADEVRKGRPKRLAVERLDAESVLASASVPAFLAAGFEAGPRRLVLRAPRA
jgi:ATP-dependent Lhr-like helicase